MCDLIVAIFRRRLRTLQIWIVTTLTPLSRRNAEVYMYIDFLNSTYFSLQLIKLGVIGSFCTNCGNLANFSYLKTMWYRIVKWNRKGLLEERGIQFRSSLCLILEQAQSKCWKRKTINISDSYLDFSFRARDPRPANNDALYVSALFACWFFIS